MTTDLVVIVIGLATTGNSLALISLQRRMHALRAAVLYVYLREDE